jgi:hypothetical protein
VSPAQGEAAPPVLYVVAAAAPPVLGISALTKAAARRGWDTCLVLTPTAARWLQADLPTLRDVTGHPIRSEYKMPGEPDLLPPADAVLVAPATSNTMNKWAAGISDTLALGLITEAIGKRLPLVAMPHLNRDQQAHPAFAASVALLSAAGVVVLLDDGGRPRHSLAPDRPEFPWELGLEALDTTGLAAGP